MSRLFALLIVLMAALLAPAQRAAAYSAPHPRATWQRCVLHLDAATMSRVNRQHCRWFAMPRATRRPVGHWTATRRLSPHVSVRVTYPVFPAKPATIGSCHGCQGAFTEPMLVTYYLATGAPMANGLYPSVGWAACGFDLPLGARVSVPGIGLLTCGDRIGYDPWHHVDVFGIPLGSGYREVTVYR